MKSLISCLILTLCCLASARAAEPAVPAGGDPNLAEPVRNFRKVVRSKDIETFSKAALALRRWMIENDPHRPIYHFTGPESWINDPNGVIYHKGKYHLFYQFDPIVDGRRSKRCWGHAVSRDLVHWVDWPVAIWPDSKYDRGGVYSGNMVIDDKGVPTALYTGNVRGHAECYGMQARSHDGFLTWKKKMVMDKRPIPESPVHWDAQIWKDGDTWFQLIGGCKGGKGAAQLWSSPDLDKWTYEKAICSGLLGPYWELPYLVPLGGRHVLFVGRGNPYWIGSYDKKTMTFKPDWPQPKYVDLGSYYSFNLHMTDDKGPGGARRQLMHGWVTGPASPTKTVPYWQGAHSIPRVINIQGDRLVQEPIPEIKVLRGKHYRFDDPGKQDLLRNVKGDALEIIATFGPGDAKRFGLKLRVVEDGKAFATVAFDTKTGRFGINGRMQPSYLKAGSPVTMHIFLDRSIVEVYVNGCAQTARIFPNRKAPGVGLFSDGGQAKLTALDIWEMKSMWSRSAEHQE